MKPERFYSQDLPCRTKKSLADLELAVYPRQKNNMHILKNFGI